LYKIFVHVRHPVYCLAVKTDAPFPEGTSKDEWRLRRSRQAGDVNSEVPEASNATAISCSNPAFSFRDSEILTRAVSELPLR
jgi:hypothetical protein